MVSICKGRIVVGSEQIVEVNVPRSETGDRTNVILDLAVTLLIVIIAGSHLTRKPVAEISQAVEVLRHGEPLARK